MEDAYEKMKEGVTDEREFINAFGEEARVLMAKDVGGNG